MREYSVEIHTETTYDIMPDSNGMMDVKNVNNAYLFVIFRHTLRYIPEIEEPVVYSVIVKESGRYDQHTECMFESEVALKEIVKRFTEKEKKDAD